VNALVLAFESESELRVAEGLIGRIKGGDKSHKGRAGSHYVRQTKGS